MRSSAKPTGALRFGYRPRRDVYFAYPDEAVRMPVLRCRYCQILRPGRHFAKVTDGLCRNRDPWVYFDPHLGRQPTQSDMESGTAFGLISHEFPSKLRAPKLWSVSYANILLRHSAVTRRRAHCSKSPEMLWGRSSSDPLGRPQARLRRQQEQTECGVCTCGVCTRPNGY